MDYQVTKNTLVQYVYLRVFSNCLSIRYLLQQKISDSMVLLVSDEGFCVDESNEERRKPSEIKLYRFQDNFGVTYRCAIALQLSGLLKQPPVALAAKILAALPMTMEEGSHQQLNLSVKLIESGWIEFHLGDRALAFWLEQLLHTSLPSPSKAINLTIDNLFRIQYSHARCCSLLRLGNRQRLINWDYRKMHLETSSPLPWFANDQLSPIQLQLQSPAEQNLLAELLDSVETIFAPGSTTDSAQIILRLSEAFLGFYDSCRIWGEVKTQTRQLAQARLGLVAVTQKLLRWYLQELLGVSAPLEL